MEDLGIEGDEAEERRIMNSMAKGLGREALELFRRPKRLVLTSLGRGSFFKEEDRYTSGSDEEEVEDGTENVEEEGTFDIDDVDDFLSKKTVPEEELQGDDSEGFPKRSTEPFARGSTTDEAMTTTGEHEQEEETSAKQENEIMTETSTTLGSVTELETGKSQTAKEADHSSGYPDVSEYPENTATLKGFSVFEGGHEEQFW